MVQEFFDDPPRTGTLLGTVIGGAMTAHPLGTLTGGVVGYMLGIPFLPPAEGEGGVGVPQPRHIGVDTLAARCYGRSDARDTRPSRDTGAGLTFSPVDGGQRESASVQDISPEMLARLCFYQQN